MRQETGNSGGRETGAGGSRSYFESSQIGNNNLFISGCYYGCTIIKKAVKKCAKQTKKQTKKAFDSVFLFKKNTLYPEKSRNSPNSSTFVFKLLNMYCYEIKK